MSRDELGRIRSLLSLPFSLTSPFYCPLHQKVSGWWNMLDIEIHITKPMFLFIWIPNEMKKIGSSHIPTISLYIWICGYTAHSLIHEIIPFSDMFQVIESKM